jgi:hypothetical protein
MTSTNPTSLVAHVNIEGAYADLMHALGVRGLRPRVVDLHDGGYGIRADLDPQHYLLITDQDGHLPLDRSEPNGWILGGYEVVPGDCDDKISEWPTSQDLDAVALIDEAYERGFIPGDLDMPAPGTDEDETVEAQCGRCGETYLPDHADDEHVQRADGTPCGGLPVFNRSWSPASTSTDLVPVPTEAARANLAAMREAAVRQGLQPVDGTHDGQPALQFPCGEDGHATITADDTRWLLTIGRDMDGDRVSRWTWPVGFGATDVLILMREGWPIGEGGPQEDVSAVTEVVSATVDPTDSGDLHDRLAWAADAIGMDTDEDGQPLTDVALAEQIAEAMGGTSVLRQILALASPAPAPVPAGTETRYLAVTLTVLHPGLTSTSDAIVGALRTALHNTGAVAADSAWTAASATIADAYAAPYGDVRLVDLNEQGW